MPDSFTFGSAGLVHELELAMQRAGGWTPAAVQKMCSGNFMAHLRNVMDGVEEIVRKDFFVDFDAEPYLPRESWSVAVHNRGLGRRKFTCGSTGNLVSTGMSLDDSPVVAERATPWTRENENIQISGHEVRKIFLGRKLLTANMIDPLIRHPELFQLPHHMCSDNVPGTRRDYGTFVRYDRRSVNLFLLGTIYADEDGKLYAPYVQGGERGGCYRSFRCLDEMFDGFDRILLFE